MWINPVEFHLSCTLDETDEDLQRLLAATQQSLNVKFTSAIGFNNLVRPYFRKALVLFNLLVTAVFSKPTEKNKIIDTHSNPTTLESIETQINIQHLLLNYQHDIVFEKSDFMQIEIDFAKYLTCGKRRVANVWRGLLSIQQLYFIIDEPREFYPFGLIKTRSILSMLMEDPSKAQGIRKASLDELTELMQKTAMSEVEIDDSCCAAWKFINGHLKSMTAELKEASDERWLFILKCLRNISEPNKSSGLR